jgi:L-alanine-DL-glutamate epimerase-like enolase superfamily enzyme
MRVSNVHAELYRVPPRVALSDAIQQVDKIEFVVVTIETDTGIRGTGWTYTGVGGLALRDLVNTYIAQFIIGSDASRIGMLWQKVWNELHIAGSAGMTALALSAVDIALWDVSGKHHGVPLFRLWGGHRESVPVYASGLDLHLSPDELAERLQSYLALGYKAVKIKVGRDNPDDDIARVAAARETVGPGVALYLDANQKWAPGTAVQRIESLARFRPGWIEEPVLADNSFGSERVRAKSTVPVALGETLYTRFQFADAIRAGSVDIVQPDLGRVGGYSEWLRIANLASAFGLPVAPHYMPELTVHAMCSIDNGLVLENTMGMELRELGLTASSFDIRDGLARPAEAPGHGVILDEDFLKRHLTDGSFTVKDTRLESRIDLG